MACNLFLTTACESYESNHSQQQSQLSKTTILHLLPPWTSLRGLGKRRRSIICATRALSMPQPDGSLKERWQPKRHYVFDSARRPVRRFILSLIRQLAGFAAIRQHGPNLQAAGAVGLEHYVPSVRRPTGALVASSVFRKLDQLLADDIHSIDVEIAARASPAERQQLPVW